MKRLNEMIEQVKRQRNIQIILPIEAQKQLGSKYRDSFDTKMFFHFLEHVHPFVFSPKNKKPEEIDGARVYQHEMDENYVIPEIASPFRVWSAEIAGDGFITVPRDSDGPIGVSIIAFLAVEQENSSWIYFSYVDFNGKKEVVLTTELDTVAHALVERMYSEKTGVEHGRKKIKVGSGKNKKFIKINRTIHVRPKRLVLADIKSDDSKEIDWTHRWSVRAHWRMLPDGKIGKNRDGNYFVIGKTWIIEHIKGPKTMPLIQKTRLVTE